METTYLSLYYSQMSPNMLMLAHNIKMLLKCNEYPLPFRF